MVESGTSMAAPHTAGLAALVRQAHPNWRRTTYWKAAIENTADPAKVAGYLTRLAGSGLIQAAGATQTQVVATGNDDSSALNFGFAELGGDYRRTLTVELRNFGPQPATFRVGTDRAAGSPHTTSLSRSSVQVPARGRATISVTLRVPAATAGTSAAFADVTGLVTFTPVAGANGGVTLRIPYYLVPQSVSSVSTSLNTAALLRTGSATATVTNRTGVGRHRRLVRLGPERSAGTGWRVKRHPGGGDADLPGRPDAGDRDQHVPAVVERGPERIRRVRGRQR